MSEITPSCREDACSLGLQSARAEALGLYRMLGRDGNTVKELRELIAVPPRIERVLRAFARAHPEEAHAVEKSLKFRVAVATEFERLVRDVVPVAELPEADEGEQHASKDRGAAAAGRVANQDRQRIERSEVIQWGEVLVGRQVGSEKQTRPVSGTAQRAALAT